MKRNVIVILLIVAMCLSAVTGCGKQNVTPTAVPTSAPESTPKVTPTEELAPTNTPTSIPSPTEEAVLTPDVSPTVEPTKKVEVTNTPEPTVTPTPTELTKNTPVPTVTNTPTVTSTLAPTVTSTLAPTVTSTLAPTATSTPVPTATPTTAVQLSATPKPTATNTPKPTATNIPKPTATNTPKPTATSTPVPTLIGNTYIYELPIDLGQYKSYSRMNSGIILVESDNGWGAFDRNGKNIVPCKYSGSRWQSATDTGYFLLSDEDGVRYVFDKTGKIIDSGSDIEQLYNNYYIKVNFDEENGQYEIVFVGDGVSLEYLYEIGYYNYDKKLVLTTNELVYVSSDVSILGENNGLLTVYKEEIIEDFDSSDLEAEKKAQIMKEYEGCLADDIFVRASCPINSYIGTLDKDGNVTWLLLYSGPKYLYSGMHKRSDIFNDGDSDEDEDEYEDEYALELISFEYLYPYPQSGIQNGYALVAYFNNLSYSRDYSIYNVNKQSYGKLIPVIYKSNLVNFWESSTSHYNYGNRIVLYSENKYFLINGETGETLGEYDFLRLSEDGIAAFEKDGKCGYCDMNGNILKTFDDVGEMAKGYSAVINERKGAIINKNMEVIAYVCDAIGIYACGGELAIFDTIDGYKYYYVAEKNTPVPTATSTPKPTNSPTPTGATATPVPTKKPTPTPTATPTPTQCLEEANTSWNDKLIAVAVPYPKPTCDIVATKNYSDGSTRKDYANGVEERCYSDYSVFRYPGGEKIAYWVDGSVYYMDLNSGYFRFDKSGVLLTYSNPERTESWSLKNCRLESGEILFSYWACEKTNEMVLCDERGLFVAGLSEVTYSYKEADGFYIFNDSIVLLHRKDGSEVLVTFR